MEHFTVSEIEEETGVAADVVRGMLREGLLVGFMENGAWTVPAESVDLLLDLIDAAECDEGDDEDDDI